MKWTLLALLAGCTSGLSTTDMLDATTTLEYTTRISPPQQEQCLAGGTFALVGTADQGALTLTGCSYGDVELDTSSSVAVVEAVVATPDNVAENSSTLTGSLVLSAEGHKQTCNLTVTITRTNTYMAGTLIYAVERAQGSLCDQTVNCYFDEYPEENSDCM